MIRLRVLIVDDERPLRDALSRTLHQRAGYHVTTAGSAAEAIAEISLAAARGEMIDVVLTDIELGPGPDGWALRRELLRVAPDRPVILMSGSVDQCTAAWHQGIPYLSKPFDVDDLTEVLRGVMAASDTTKETT